MRALSDAFLDAPFDVDGWERALRLLAAETRSTHGQLIGIGGPALIPFNIAPDVDEAALREFIEIEGGSPARNFRVAASRDPLQLVHEDHYAEVRPSLADDVYNDYCVAHDIPHGNQTVLSLEGGQLIGLATLRSRRDGPSDADQRAIFMAAAPDALRAVRLQQRLDNQGSLLVAGALDSVGLAAFVLDAAGRVCAMTPLAEAAASAGDRLRLRAGRLRAPLEREQAGLDQALARALGAARRETCLALNGPRGRPGLVDVIPLPARPHDLSFAPRAVVVLRGGRARPPADLLRALIGFTAAESEVAADMASGLSREEVAQMRGVSAGTVHAQLKTVFAKAGVTREAELVALLRRLVER